MYKILIAGSRDFDDYEYLEVQMNYILHEIIKEDEVWDNVIILSGGARGADKLGEQFADVYDFGIEQHIPDWNKHGRKAGILRNKVMVDKADLVVVFWDGKSRGSKHVIEYSKEVGKDAVVFKYKEE
jgi:hypothetical protein